MLLSHTGRALSGERLLYEHGSNSIQSIFDDERLTKNGPACSGSIWQDCPITIQKMNAASSSSSSDAVYL